MDTPRGATESAEISRGRTRIALRVFLPALRCCPVNGRAVLFLFLLAVWQVCAAGQIQILQITSSANFAPGLLKPGSLVSIFCTGLQAVPDLAAAPGYPLPYTLAGVTVTFDGIAAPLLAVANLGGGTFQQINLQIPWEAATANGLNFDVSQGGVSGHFTATGSTSWPVFFVDPSGYAIAQHAGDWRLVTPADPARPGEWVVVWATNLGAVQNQPPDGNLASSQVLAPIVQDPSPYLNYYGIVTGDYAAIYSPHIQSNYIGLAPGSILYQVNLLVPSAQPAGDLVFQMLKIYDCGFFFIPGCGRSFTTKAASMPGKIPVIP
jgi:uncharacterized protein (TIGR03437 family)